MTKDTDPQAQAIRLAEGEPALSAFADYLRSKFDGRKAEAKAASERFAAQLDAADLEEAICAVRALTLVQGRFGGLPGVMPYPVALAASRVCQRWEQQEPTSAEPLVQRAGFEWNPALYVEAFARDPSHPVALAGYVVERLRWLCSAFHTIERGAVSEPETEVRQVFDELPSLLDRLANASLAQEGRALITLYRRLFEGLTHWREAGAEGAFTDYMKAQGLDVSALPELLN